MLYSAKLKTEYGESERKNINARNYNEALEKAKELVCKFPYNVCLVDVFLVGSDADKRGYYNEED